MLKEFIIGNAIWDKMVLESLMPLAHTGIERFMFCGKSITENDYSFLGNMPNLKEYAIAAQYFQSCYQRRKYMMMDEMVGNIKLFLYKIKK